MNWAPIKLLPSRHVKPWGSRNLAPWFDSKGEQIGEYWFTADANLSSTGQTLGELMEAHGQAITGTKVKLAEAIGSSGRFPILVKFLFTTGDLSIQVHPDDVYGWANENSPGKTEMWYVLNAEPGAKIALGFKKITEVDRVRESVKTGEIVDLMEWVDAKPGQAFFTPAGTVHAIGAGLAICEIQQNSDITYRFYDFNREPLRELHVEKSLAVADLKPHPGAAIPVETAEGARLATCEYFETELLHFLGSKQWTGDPERFHLLIFTRGSGSIAGHDVRLGDCWLIPAACPPYDVETSEPVEMLRAYVPASTHA